MRILAAALALSPLLSLPFVVTPNLPSEPFLWAMAGAKVKDDDPIETVLATSKKLAPLGDVLGADKKPTDAQIKIVLAAATLYAEHSEANWKSEIQKEMSAALDALKEASKDHADAEAAVQSAKESLANSKSAAKTAQAEYEKAKAASDAAPDNAVLKKDLTAKQDARDKANQQVANDTDALAAATKASTSKDGSFTKLETDYLSAAQAFFAKDDFEAFKEIVDDPKKLATAKLADVHVPGSYDKWKAIAGVAVGTVTKTLTDATQSLETAAKPDFKEDVFTEAVGALQDILDATKQASALIDGLDGSETCTDDLAKARSGAVKAVKEDSLPMAKSLRSAVESSIDSIAKKIQSLDSAAPKSEDKQNDSGSSSKDLQESAARSDIFDLRTQLGALAKLNRDFKDGLSLFDSTKPALKIVAQIEVEAGQAVGISDDRIAGINQDWVFSRVNLYYYPNPMAILRSLRPEVEPTLLNEESKKAEADALAKAKALSDAESAIFSAQANLNDLKAKALTINTEIAAINQKARILASQQSDLKNQIDQLNRDNPDLAKFDEIKVRVDQGNNDPTLAEDKEKLAKLTPIKDQADRLAGQKADVDSQKDAADATHKKLVEDDTKLPADLRAAEDAVSKAQSELAKARADRFVKATEDVDAFGAFATEEPVYRVAADAARLDPAGRVQIVMFPRSKVLMLRGASHDVAAVRSFIDAYDRPTPQAKITIHSFQLNGANVKSLNDAIAKAESSIRDTKASISIVQDALRGAITREIGRVEAAARKTFPGTRFSGRWYRSFFFSDAVRSQLGQTQDATPDEQLTLRKKIFNAALAEQDLQECVALFARANSSELAMGDYDPPKGHGRARRVEEFRRRETLTRLAYALNLLADHCEKAGYQPNIDGSSPITKLQKWAAEIQKGVRQRDDSTNLIKKAALGDAVNEFSKSISDYLKGVLAEAPKLQHPRQIDADFCEWTMPEPAKATTLGEMIFILSLATQDARQKILADMGQQLYFDSIVKVKAAGSERWDRVDRLTKFASSLVSEYGNQALTGEFMLEAQGQRPYPTFPNKLFGASTLSSRYTGGISEILASYLPANDATSSNQQEILFAIRERLLAHFTRVLTDKTLSEHLSTELKMKIATFALSILHVGPSDNPVYELRHLSQVIGTESRARTAAADMMIKSFMESFESDFAHFFMDPMMDDLRNGTKADVEFGGYERREILASNRLLARVDVDASDTAEMGADRNLLDEAGLLFQLYNKVNRPSGASGVGNSLANGLGTGLVASELGAKVSSSAGFGLLGLLFSGLSELPQEPQGEIYSIGTGGAFKVTPIFNPSGQGLTFRFDYTQQVRLQEPDGTTLPDISRVERHSVNTEVQVTNMDLQTISSFESNYKIGSPLKRSGGIPILRDLFPSVPLVGYFVQRGGSPAKRQHSLIFAQTNMYPTVADLVDLMVDAPFTHEVLGSSGPTSTETIKFLERSSKKGDRGHHKANPDNGH